MRLRPGNEDRLFCVVLWEFVSWLLYGYVCGGFLVEVGGGGVCVLCGDVDVVGCGSCLGELCGEF